MSKVIKPTRIERVWRWKQRSTGMRYTAEMVEIELTETELQIQKRQLKVVELLKKILETQDAKNMLKGEEIPISEELSLRSGKLYYWHKDTYWYEDKCVMPSDCDGAHQSAWVSEKSWVCVEPSLAIVQRFGVTIRKTKTALRQLRKK